VTVMHLVAVGSSPLVMLVGLLVRPRGGRSNLWDVLHELARSRGGAGLERERRATLEVLLERLPDSHVRIEDSDGPRGGRRTVINREAAEDGPRA
jgi:hypothetical protein